MAVLDEKAVAIRRCFEELEEYRGVKRALEEDEDASRRLIELKEDQLMALRKRQGGPDSETQQLGAELAELQATRQRL